MELTAENLEVIFLDCLFKDGEDTGNRVVGEGVVTNYGFHPERLKSHHDQVKDMLSQLPEGFMKSKGGGWSFLQACENNKGEQWADLHQTMEKLVCLGMALKLTEYLMPRAMWPALPGSMPYIVVLD